MSTHTFTFHIEPCDPDPARWTPVEGAWDEPAEGPPEVYEAIDKALASRLAAGDIEEGAPLLCEIALFVKGRLTLTWKVEVEVNGAPAAAWPFEMSCIFCGCTDAWGCQEGCWWVDDEHERAVCSVCDGRANALVGRLEAFLGEALQGEARPFGVRLLHNLLQRFELERAYDADAVYFARTRWRPVGEGWLVLHNQVERNATHADLRELVEAILLRDPHVDPDDRRWEVR